MTSKKRRHKRLTAYEKRKKAFNSKCHIVIKNRTTYKIIMPHFIEPKQTIFFISSGACGYCPMSIICWSNQPWDKLKDTYNFCRCDRCSAFGFIHKQTEILYICFLLRNNRIANTWIINRKKRDEGYRRVNSITQLSDSFLGYMGEISPHFAALGDIPFGCVTRCRNTVGEITLTEKLGGSVDCRTTISNAVTNIVRY